MQALTYCDAQHHEHAHSSRSVQGSVGAMEERSRQRAEGEHTDPMMKLEYTLVLIRVAVPTM